MTHDLPESPPFPSAIPARPAPAATTSEKGLYVMACGLALVSVAWLVHLLMTQSTVWGGWLLEVFVAGSLLCLALWATARHRRLWALPAAQLLGLMSQVRRGELPIEALAQVTGEPAVFVPILQELLHELRGHRAEHARLEQEMAQRVANRTDALERALGSLRQQASRDPLTGLYNRRMLDEHLPRLVGQRHAERGALSLLMIDVDHFKLLNDTLGHAAGDALLRSIGQLIRSSIRESDLAFRCGGDEFVIVLDNSDGTSARRLSDRLVELVDALAKPLKLPRPPRLSIGMSQLGDLRDPTPAALLHEADRMLYEVKGARRSTAA